MKFRTACLLAALSLSVWAQSPQPDDPLSRARSLVEAGKLTDAESLLRDALRQTPASADLHFLLGYVLFREQKASDSLAEFTAGARYRRPAADDFRVIASDYVLLGDYNDAATWYAEVTREKPTDPQAWYFLGRAQFNEEHFTPAIASFERALSLRPRYIEAENNLGLAWLGLNNNDRARAAFQTAVDWQQDRPVDPQPYLNLGTLLTGQGEPAKALPLLRIAVGLAPGNPKIHDELSHAYEALSDLPAAQQELEKATALAPDVSALHFRLGRIYARQGLRDRAQQQFDICAKLANAHSSATVPNPYTPD